MTKKLLIAFMCLVLLTSCSSRKESMHYPLPSEVKGMWFSFVDYRTFLKETSSEDIEKEIDEILDNCEELGINTLFVHTVAFTDAFYDSKIYPKSNVVSEKDIDYLKIFVEKAHQRKMHIEAWINPMRSVTSEEMASMDESYILKQWVNEGNDSIYNFEGRYYLNIATEDTQTLILSVVEEILTNYDVDGIHMDDYFYPAKVDDGFDINQFKGSSFQTIAEFRKYQVNELVDKIQALVHKKSLVFGISPSGNIEYSRDVIFGDTEAWIKNGSIDYVVPQLYWGYTNKAKPFENTLQEWQGLVEGTEIPLIVGLAAYKMGVESKDSDREEWMNDPMILDKQIETSRSVENYGGYIYFSYHSLFLK